MSKPSGTTDPNLQKLIVELKKTSTKNKNKIWKEVARILSNHSRKRIATNISRVNRVTKDGEIIVIPGKLLGAGALDHKLTISAWNASKSALEKIKNIGGSFIPLPQLLKKMPKGKDIKIIK